MTDDRKADIAKWLNRAWSIFMTAAAVVLLVLMATSVNILWDMATNDRETDRNLTVQACLSEVAALSADNSAYYDEHQAILWQHAAQALAASNDPDALTQIQLVVAESEILIERANAVGGLADLRVEIVRQARADLVDSDSQEFECPDVPESLYAPED